MPIDTNYVLDNLWVALSPEGAAVLFGIAAFCFWLALGPSVRPRQQVEHRLDQFGDSHEDIIEEERMSLPFFQRVFMPVVRGILRIFGRLMPSRNVTQIERMLIEAGEPLRINALDFLGLRLIMLFVPACLYYLLFRDIVEPNIILLRNTVLFAALGYFLPGFWLRRRVRQRKDEITRALPDALDMLSIGVEAGLGFESAMVRVGERWDNALTHEFRRAVTEMRLGTPRNEALRNMAHRTGTDALHSFVTVLIQSSQLGVSIGRVLHAQAAQERTRRRQRAEELARQAGGKMVFPLVFLILPTLFVVMLGPAIPRMGAMLATMRAGH